MRTAKLVLFAVLLSLGLAGVVMAQTDTNVVVPSMDPHTQFVAGLGLLAAYIAREIGSLLVGLWNKAGGWLDGKSNGSKRAVAVALTGALGLAINAVQAALTHTTNWVIAFGLSLVLGIIGTVNAGVIIDSVKSKFSASRVSSGIR